MKELQAVFQNFLWSIYECIDPYVNCRKIDDQSRSLLNIQTENDSEMDLSSTVDSYIDISIEDSLSEEKMTGCFHSQTAGQVPHPSFCTKWSIARFKSSKLFQVLR